MCAESFTVLYLIICHEFCNAKLGKQGFYKKKNGGYAVPRRKKIVLKYKTGAGMEGQAARLVPNAERNERSGTPEHLVGRRDFAL